MKRNVLGYCINLGPLCPTAGEVRGEPAPPQVDGKIFDHICLPALQTNLRTLVLDLLAILATSTYRLCILRTFSNLPLLIVLG